MLARCSSVARPALPGTRAAQRLRPCVSTRSVVTRAATKEALKEITNSQMVKEALSKVNPKLFIDGEWVDAASGRTFEDICPMNEEPLVTVAEAGPDDVERAVQAARRAFDEGPWGTTMSARERGRILYKLADLMEENLEDLAILECLDNGKSLKNCKSLDIPLSIDHFRYMAGWADKIYGSTIPTGDGTIAMTLKEPIGVVGCIIPWNFPLLMFAWKVAPALAAGCTVVLKCAEQTPLTALRVADLAARAGLPPGVLNVIPGAGDTGKALCATPGVDKLAFTGSTEVGKMVMSAGAQNIANVSLELGGKSPLIICPDADLETAASVAHAGQFFNHSQNCAASTRIFVHEDIYDDFMKRSVELAESIKIGNPFDDSVTQGPQVDQQQFEKYHKYVELGKEQGAKMYTGEGAAADIGYFVKPVIFGEVTEDMAIFKEEIFGPVMSVIKYTDLDAAIASANNTEYGLAAGVVSQNIDTINKVTRRLKAGTVWVNTYNAQDAAVPFGGYKQSGIDRDKGREGIEKYLETKSIVMKAP